MEELIGAAVGVCRRNFVRWLREMASAAAFRCPGMWHAEGVNWSAAAMKNRQRVRCASVLWRDDPDCIAATTWELSDQNSTRW